jgi:hypothetical protein
MNPELENKLKKLWANCEKKIVDAASKKLGVGVSLKYWQRQKNGADIPIFNIPETHQAQAQALGLSFE